VWDESVSGRVRKKEPASSFYRHKKGRSTCTGRSRKSSSSPRIGGVQWMRTVESTLWGMATGGTVALRSSVASRGLRRRPDDSCGRYRPPCLSWRSAEGSADGVSPRSRSVHRSRVAPMLAEGCVEEEVRGVGSTVVRAVRGTSAQGVAGSHRVRTVPGMAAQ